MASFLLEKNSSESIPLLQHCFREGDECQSVSTDISQLLEKLNVVTPEA